MLAVSSSNHRQRSGRNLADGHAIPGPGLLLTTWHTPALGFRKQERMLRTGSTGGCLRSIAQCTRSGACSYWISMLSWEAENSSYSSSSCGQVWVRTAYFGLYPTIYINCHPRGFWIRSFYRLLALPVTQPTASKHWRPRCWFCFLAVKAVITVVGCLAGQSGQAMGTGYAEPAVACGCYGYGGGLLLLFFLEPRWLWNLVDSSGPLHLARPYCWSDQRYGWATAL